MKKLNTLILTICLCLNTLITPVIASEIDTQQETLTGNTDNNDSSDTSNNNSSSGDENSSDDNGNADNNSNNSDGENSSDDNGNADNNSNDGENSSDDNGNADNNSNDGEADNNSINNENNSEHNELDENNSEANSELEENSSEANSELEESNSDKDTESVTPEELQEEVGKYTVTLINDYGIDNVELIEEDKSYVIAKASVNKFFTFDGWYEGSEKISSELEYRFKATKDTELVAKGTVKENRLGLFIYATESDDDIIKLSHSVKVWVPIGSEQATNELIHKFSECGVDTKYSSTVSATDLVNENSELQGYISKAGLDYNNYKWRLVYEKDGFHIDGVIHTAKFPSNDIDEPVTDKSELPNLLMFIYAVETDEDIMKLSHSPNMWYYFGKSGISDSLYEQILSNGLTLTGDTKKIRATDFVGLNGDIQAIVNSTNLDYSKYEWRLVYEADGIHLDGVIRKENFPSSDSSVDDAVDVSDETDKIKDDTKNVLFAIDGIYDEWIDYPHTVLTYSGGDDAYSAVYKADDYSYFNVYTEMPAHLSEAGGEFTSGISVVFNDNWETAFYPRFITVDGEGNIDWNPQLNGLSKGIYHFYLCSTDAWHTSTNIDNLHETDIIYGDAYIKIDDTRDEIEWKLDMNLIAKRFGIDSSEIKTVQVSYSRLGPQTTISAGTPTGAVGGVMIAVVIAVPCSLGLGAGIITRKKRKRQ